MQDVAHIEADEIHDASDEATGIYASHKPAGIQAFHQAPGIHASDHAARVQASKASQMQVAEIQSDVDVQHRKIGDRCSGVDAIGSNIDVG